MIKKNYLVCLNMGAQPRSCKCGYSPLAPEDKFCPMCKEPVVKTDSRLASLSGILMNSPRLFLIGFIICLVLLSFAFILTEERTKKWQEEEYIRKGQDAFDNGENLEALKYFDWVQLINPNNSKALYGKGDILIEIYKKPSDVFTGTQYYFKQIERENNRSTDSYIYNLKIGDYYNNIEKESKDAESYYRKAENLSRNGNPEDQAIALTKMGIFLLDSYLSDKDKSKESLDKDKLKESLSYFDKCINISRGCSKCQENEAKCNSKKGKILSELDRPQEEIEKYYINGLNLDPKAIGLRMELCNNLNKTRIKTGDKTATQVYNDKCIE
jgi:hypothetical protein